MFKAIDTTSNHAVISLDDNGEAWLDDLRRKGQEGVLCCQTCKQAVLLKAGTIRRPHFAHKTLAECPSSKESPELLQARAVLYEWLRAKFREQVTLEKQIVDPAVPRPVDCWAEREGRQYAYWVGDKRLSWDTTRQIREAVKKSGAVLTWVFPATKLTRMGDRSDVLTLPTTQRDCITQSDFDGLYGRHGGGSLHYLDADAKTIITFRAMSCVHDPQGYAGHELRTLLTEILINPPTGEFVHPAEYEKLKEVERERHLERERQRRQIEEARHWRAARATKPAVELRIPPVVPRPDTVSPPSQPFRPTERAGTCTDCGQVTSDWWMFDGKTGTCRCNECKRKRDAAQ